jgi:hypothetical protein
MCFDYPHEIFVSVRHLVALCSVIDLCRCDGLHAEVREALRPEPVCRAVDGVSDVQRRGREHGP